MEGLHHLPLVERERGEAFRGPDRDQDGNRSQEARRGGKTEETSRR